MGGSQSSDLTSDHQTAANGDGGDESVEVLSREPRLSVHHNFLSKEECEHLITLAKPNLKRSRVAYSLISEGEGVENSTRTSSDAFLKRGQDEIIRDIEERIAKWTLIPADHGEGLQVLLYQVGQKFEPHWDYCADPNRTRNGDNRMATVIMYLSDVDKGGETVFPKAKGLSSGRRGISVKPKMGDALLFWNMKPDGSLDPLTWHGLYPCGSTVLLLWVYQKHSLNLFGEREVPPLSKGTSGVALNGFIFTNSNEEDPGFVHHRQCGLCDSGRRRLNSSRSGIPVLI